MNDAAGARAPDAGASSASPCTVLLVDDDDVATEGVLRSFSRNNVRCRVVTAVNGAEALAVLHGDRPDKRIHTPVVVLLDLNMPVMDGFQFLQALRADPKLTRTVVFVLTTSARDEDRYRAYDEHVAGYMVKSAVGPQFSKLAAFIDAYAQTQSLP